MGSKKEFKIVLPEKTTASLKVKLTETRDEVYLCIEQLLNDQSGKHLQILQKVSRNLDICSTSPNWNLLIELLVHVLFHFPQETALKSMVNGIIRQLPELCFNVLFCFAEEKLNTQSECTSTHMIELVDALIQSDVGKRVVKDLHDVFISHSEVVLNSLINVLIGTNSCTQSSDINSEVHKVIRTLLSVINLKPQIKIEDHSGLLLAVITILNLGETPLEIQSNCSKILVIVLVTKENGLKNLTRKMSGQSVEEPFSLLYNLNDCPRVLLNLCLGTISSLDTSDLLTNFPGHGTVLGGIILPNILIKFKDDGLCSSSLLVLIGRCFELWMVKCFECLNQSSTSNLLLEEWRQFQEDIFETIFNKMEHQIDTLRYSAKSSFQSYLNIYQLTEGNVKPILETVLIMPPFKKSKYTALTCLSKSPDLVSDLLNIEPNLGTELLFVATDPSVFNQAKEVFNSLMFHCMNCGENWTNNWLYPLLNAVGNHPQGFESSLCEILKIKPSLVSELQKWFEMDSTDSSRLKVFITTIQSCRKLGLLPTSVADVSNENSLWNNMVKVVVMKEALEHEDPKIRLIAFGAIVEGPKSTQLFSDQELEWIREFVVDDMGNPNAAFRQQFCSSMKKLLLKLRDGGTPLISRKEHPKTVASYRHFLDWLIGNCLSELGPESNFSRRFLALQILKLVKEIFDFHNGSKGLNCRPCLTEHGLSSLVDCLFDSFDTNKEMALDLLKARPLLDLMNQDAEWIQIHWKLCCALSQSIRSADTISAAFLFRLLVRLDKLDGVIQIENRNGWTFHTRNAFFLMSHLIELLKLQVKLAKDDTHRMGIDVPIYGLLLAIRFLLVDQQQRITEMNDDSWEGLLDDLIVYCFEASEVASPIVTSESPEGFVPEIDTDQLATLTGDQECSKALVNAQALLVCAWRTVKEIALLFGQLSSWMIETHSQLIKSETILRMGWHLRKLLLETKHRGAFEQVYCGFSQLCYALWKCQIDELHRLPTVWLNEVLNDIKTDLPLTKLCATRRSAGLPYMFQAILSPEIEVGHGQLFAETMESLLHTGTNGTTENRIHSLNILRTLYRESRLSQVVGSYVARGLILAISGFEASDWPERNSSTLLFSALMTRIFGVPRSKTDFQKKNSLTGRAFFQMYPQLYPFLLDRLSNVVADLHHGHELHPSLFPVLVLMGRLHPAPCEAVSVTFQLEPFVPLVRQCGSSSVLKTRQLAAKALLPLLTSSLFNNLIQQLFDEVPQSRSHNALHGTLLQIRHFIDEIVEKTTTRDELIQIVKRNVPGLIFLLQNTSYVIRYEYVGILEVVVDILDGNFKNSVLKFCLSELNCSQQIGGPFYPLYCQKLGKVAVLFGSFTSDVLSLLNHPLQEVRIEVMELLKTSDLSSSEMIAPQLVKLINNSDDSAERSLALSLVTRMIEQPWIEYVESSNLEHKLTWTLELYQNSYNENIQGEALVTASRLINHGVYNPEIAEHIRNWSFFLKDECDSSASLRLAVIQSLEICSKLLFGTKEASFKWGDVLSNCWTCLFRCLTDDNTLVRSTASTVVRKLLEDNTTVHSSVALKKALDFFVKNVGHDYQKDVVLTLVNLALSSEEPIEAESTAFEKGDSDTFYDCIFHSTLYINYINKSVVLNGFPHTDIDCLKKVMEEKWESMKHFDISNVECFNDNRRRTNNCIIDLLKLHLLSCSLASIDSSLSMFYQQMCYHFDQLPKYWIGHSMQLLKRVVRES